jgi:hypothetical protein
VQHGDHGVFFAFLRIVANEADVFAYHGRYGEQMRHIGGWDVFAGLISVGADGETEGFFEAFRQNECAEFHAFTPV